MFVYNHMQPFILAVTSHGANWLCGPTEKLGGPNLARGPPVEDHCSTVYVHLNQWFPKWELAPPGDVEIQSGCADKWGAVRGALACRRTLRGLLA